MDRIVPVDATVRSLIRARLDSRSSGMITAVRTTREIQIDELGRLGVPPVICNSIKQETCGTALALSEDQDKFNFWIERLKDVQSAKVIALSEKTRAQVEQDRMDSDPQAKWAERTKAIQPI